MESNDLVPGTEVPTTGEQPDGGAEEPLGAGFDFTDPASRLAPLYLKAGPLAAVTLLAVVFVVFSVLPVWHTDVWGHLAFGRWMVAHRALPGHEPFSPFTDQESPYAPFQWLSQVGLYLAYRLGELRAGGDAVRAAAGGVQMLHAVHVLLAVSSYALLLAAYRRRAQGSLPLACVGVVAALVLQPTAVTIFRPQVVGFALFCLLLVPLSRPVLSRRALVLVPLLFALWVNMHGSYAVGLVVVGVLGTCRAVATLLDGPAWSVRRVWADAQAVRLLAVLLLGGAAAAFCNPHGPALFVETARLGANPIIGTLEEWRPLVFAPRLVSLWAVAAALVLLGVTQLSAPRPMPTGPLVLVVLFTLWACLQQRMLVWLMPLVIWSAVPLWAESGQRRGWAWLADPSTPSLRKTLLAAFLVAVASLWFSPLGFLLGRSPKPLDQAASQGTPWRLAAQLQTDPAAPVSLLPALRDALEADYPEGRYCGRIYATETQGDYLLWALPAETPVLMYAHPHLFPPAHWDECQTIKFAGPAWWDLLDRHRVNLVVVEAELYTRLADALRHDPAWVVVLDEAGDRAKPDARARLLIALRKKPLVISH